MWNKFIAQCSNVCLEQGHDGGNDEDHEKDRQSSVQKDPSPYWFGVLCRCLSATCTKCAVLRDAIVIFLLSKLFVIVHESEGKQSWIAARNSRLPSIIEVRAAKSEKFQTLLPGSAKGHGKIRYSILYLTFSRTNSILSSCSINPHHAATLTWPLTECWVSGLLQPSRNKHPCERYLKRFQLTQWDRLSHCGALIPACDRLQSRPVIRRRLVGIQFQEP